ncbi:MAG: AraC family transcriptional regulator [Mangrovibacterium sp.]
MDIPELHIGHRKIPGNLNIIVRNSEYKNEDKLESNFPHRHSFYVICLFHKGKGVHMIDFKEIEVVPRRLFILNPSQVHSWDLAPGTAVSIIQFYEMILLEQEFAGFRFLSANAMPPYLDIDDRQAQEILEISLKLEDEIKRDDRFSPEIVRGHLLTLLGTVKRIVDSINETYLLDSRKQKLYEFQMLVNQYYREQKQVNYYASRLNISPNYLNMLSREIGGKNAGQFIADRIALEAKRLLYYTSDDVSEVAFKLGFDDPSYFARFFKKQEGLSPSEFKKMIYKKYQYPHK